MMEVEGWIKLHRKSLENPTICKDSDYFAVWVYLLLNATHKEYDALFKGKRITLKKGQLITGRESIARKLKVDESKVQRILKSFESDHQIEQQTGNKNRLITITNWSKYQYDEQQNEQQLNNKRTTTEQQVNTNKNVKNVKNVKNNIIGAAEPRKPKRFISPSLDEVSAYCTERNNGIDAQYFIDHYTANGWKRGKAEIKDWKACVRTWERNNQKYQSKESQTDDCQKNKYEQYGGDIL